MNATFVSLPTPDDLVRMGAPQRGTGDWRERLWAHPFMATNRRLRWMGGLWIVTGLLLLALGFGEKGPPGAVAAGIALLMLPGASLFFGDSWALRSSCGKPPVRSAG